MVQQEPLTAILGCGPSGLLAAHACEMRQVPYVIFSKAVKSVLGGAQYSHIGIPGIHDSDQEPDAKLTYRVEGDAETYQAKVYGDSPVPFVSMSSRTDGEIVPAWSLPDMYDQLWDRYAHKVVELRVGAARVAQLLAGFDMVLSSVQLPSICMATIEPTVQHWFRQQTVRIKNEALNPNLPDNTILYDGTKDHSYYRMSRIFGVGSTEWGASSPVPPIQDIRTINKPVGTNCDCFEAWNDGSIRFRKVGRFGTWQKGILTFHAYNSAIDALADWGVM